MVPPSLMRDVHPLFSASFPVAYQSTILSLGGTASGSMQSVAMPENRSCQTGPFATIAFQGSERQRSATHSHSRTTRGMPGSLGCSLMAVLDWPSPAIRVPVCSSVDVPRQCGTITRLISIEPRPCNTHAFQACTLRLSGKGRSFHPET